MACFERSAAAKAATAVLLALVFLQATSAADATAIQQQHHSLHDGTDLRNVIGATHWNGCYNRSTKPYLIDGAEQIYNMGARVIKLALTKPAHNYPWNTEWPDHFDSPTAIANHSLFRQVFNMPFNTFVLVTYSMVDESDDNYWRNGISAQQQQQEADQFYELTLFLLSNFPDKTFVLQHWEGDWSIRGNYDPTSKPTPQAVQSMKLWLAARQDGVTTAREQHFAQHRFAGSGNVYCASEVNLVATSMTEAFPNIILSVLPDVPMDMISYSSYDTECGDSFGPALDFIASHHNKTAASPQNAVYVGEYGLPQQERTAAQTQACFKNVAETCLNHSIPYVLFWEVYDNEVRDGAAQSNRGVSDASDDRGGNKQRENTSSRSARLGTGRCAPKSQGGSGPVTDPSKLAGYWLVMPNGTHAWAYTYLESFYSS